MDNFIKSFLKNRSYKKNFKRLLKLKKRVIKRGDHSIPEYRKFLDLFEAIKNSLKEKHYKVFRQKEKELYVIVDNYFPKLKHATLFETFLSLFWAVLIALAIRTFIIEPFSIPTGSMIPVLQINDNVFVSKMAYSMRIPWTRIHLITWNHPKRGEIIIFSYPGHDSDQGKDFIKRTIAVPGDRVMMKDRVLYINGKPLETTPLLKDIACMDSPGGCEHCDAVLEKNGDYTYIVQYHNKAKCFDMGDTIWPLESPPAMTEIDDDGKPEYLGYKAINPNWPEVVVPPGHYFVMGDNRDNSKDGRYWGFVSMDRIMGKGIMIWWANDMKRIFSWMY